MKKHNEEKVVIAAMFGLALFTFLLITGRINWVFDLVRLITGGN